MAALSLRVLPFVVLFVVFPIVAVSQEEDFNHTELEWYTIETPHFLVNYHKGEERTAKVIANVAEDIYGPVTALYHHVPDQKVNFVVKDYDDYSNGGAYFFDNKIEIFAPALDFDLRGTHDWLRNVVTHEFTHIVQIQTSMKFGRRIPAIYLQWLNYEEERRPDVLYGYPNVIASYPVSGFVVPSWFAEGVAQYNRPQLGYDSWDSHRDMILRMYAVDGKMLSWNEMSVFGKTSLGNESSYNAGFSLVGYISRTYGADAIVRISRNLSRIDALTIDGAIERAIGKSGRELYAEWKGHETSEYRRRIAPVETKRVEGDPIAVDGFGNFFPAFSPDGSHLAYTSNKKSDYFGLSDVYLYDPATRRETKSVEHVRSSLSWSPDGRKIYYARVTRDNPHWSNVGDLFVYDIQRDEEKRLTHGLRAAYPAVSPDGSLIVSTIEGDGTTNLALVDSAGGGMRMLTDFREGEQVFTPSWSPDGHWIVFGFERRDGQDVAMIPSSGGAMEVLVGGGDDARNPVFSPDGRSVYFSSDRTGIFNIYALDLATKKTGQITNVLGGAFMPAISVRGDLAFVNYTSDGFKINRIEHPVVGDFSDASYLPSDENPLRPDTSFDWTRLQNYNDRNIPEPVSKPYKTTATSLSIIPLLRIDNYNTKNAGIDFLKPGFYFTSSDMLDKVDIFGGVAINRILERDLFLTFDYRGSILGLSALGLSPTVSLEIYNITRNTDQLGQFGLVTVPLQMTIGLLEFDLYFKQHLFLESDLLTVGLTHSQYNTDVATFIMPGGEGEPGYSVPGSSDIYLRGNDLSLQYDLTAIAPSRNSDINPVGRKLRLRFGYEMNRFNSTNALEVTPTGVSLLLTPFDFVRGEVQYVEALELPGWVHTLTLTLHGGTIFGPPVPDFFDFYAGGLPGMRGYPFYAIEGNNVATIEAAYRFPMWENIDTRVLEIYFDKLYGSIQGDFGNAWTSGTTIDQFKRDAGFELRLEGYSFYAFPTRIFFNGTYGFDSFTTLTHDNVTVRYGREWRFYFGVLFGFDLD